MNDLKAKLVRLKDSVTAKAKKVIPNNLTKAFEVSKDLIEEGGKVAINSLKQKSISMKIKADLS